MKSISEYLKAVIKTADSLFRYAYWDAKACSSWDEYDLVLESNLRFARQYVECAVCTLPEAIEERVYDYFGM